MSSRVRILQCYRSIRFPMAVPHTFVESTTLCPCILYVETLELLRNFTGPYHHKELPFPLAPGAILSMCVNAQESPSGTHSSLAFESESFHSTKERYGNYIYRYTRLQHMFFILKILAEKIQSLAVVFLRTETINNISIKEFWFHGSPNPFIE